MLKIESLSAGYGGTTVLHDFDLELEAGQIAAVIGPNGCGKSTLLHCLAGLLQPMAGRVLLQGRDLAGMSLPERARTVALLPQSPQFNPHLAAGAMVLLGRTPYLGAYGLPGPHDDAVAGAALTAVGAASLAERPLASLSGGELQRVLMARALAQQPRLLLLDEPVSHLDLRYQYEVLALARRLAGEGLAILVVLHQINLASALADHLVLLSESGLVQAAGVASQVITEHHLRSVYRLPLTVNTNPETGRPQVQAAWRFDAPPSAASDSESNNTLMKPQD